ncbi:MAG: ATP-binding protein [Planctomycetota bacterium]
MMHRAERLLEMAETGAWFVDVETGALEWTDEVFRIHDLPVGDPPTVEEAIAFYPEDTAAEVAAAVEKACTEAGTFEFVVPLVTARGRRIWVHTRGGAEVDADGKPLTVFGMVRDVTERKEAEDRLRAGEERLRRALEGARDGVWEWEVETDRMHFSPRWKEIIGYADDEIADDFDEWRTRVPDDEAEEALRIIEDCLTGKRDEYRAEFRMRHKDGSWRWILARASVFERDELGRAKRFVGTHTDITEEVHMREELVEAKNAAETAARAKSSFLATMSHEIRTPMNGVLGLANVLLGTELSDEQEGFVRSIRDSGNALLSVLNDILDLSKAEAGMVDLENGVVDVVACAEDVYRLFEHDPRRSDAIQLSVHPSLSVPRAIAGDPGRVRQVLLNLVGNAVKFTHKGSVEIHLTSAEDRVRVEVRDTGIGIDPKRRANLFEPFTQADASMSRRYGGTGLGLSISRHLVALMGGTLDCGDNAPRGTVFWFELPAVEVDPTDADGSDAEAFDGGGQLVLVAEDNPVNQVVARRTLERLGFEVSVVGNGLEAVHAVEADVFEFVFMDVQMPLMDGYEATERIAERFDLRGESPPAIIVLTANAMSGDRERALAAGADDYAAKPIVVEELVAAMQRVRRRQAAA